MSRLWRTLASAAVLLLALVQCTAAESPSESKEEGQSAKVRIQLMTSLPLVWGDEASMETILSGGSEPAPIYRYWQSRYDIAAVDSLESLAEKDPDIVILAQPRAMHPADLTALDAWVRAGGNVIILTDPDLVWPSELPLGDPRRPLASGLLSPLLGHWGLELVAAADRNMDAVDLRFDSYSFVTRGVGKLKPLPESKSYDVNCQAGAGGFLVQCSVGQGQAAIVADADFLNAGLWPESVRQMPQKSGAGRLVDSLVEGQLLSAGQKK